MRKSTLTKAAALFVCLGLLLLSVPNANAVEKKAPKFHFLKKPAMIINSIIPFFTSIFDSGKSSPDINKSGKKVKITGNSVSPKVADGD